MFALKLVHTPLFNSPLTSYNRKLVKFIVGGVLGPVFRD